MPKNQAQPMTQEELAKRTDVTAEFIEVLEHTIWDLTEGSEPWIPYFRARQVESEIDAIKSGTDWASKEVMQSCLADTLCGFEDGWDAHIKFGESTQQ